MNSIKLLSGLLISQFIISCTTVSPDSVQENGTYTTLLPSLQELTNAFIITTAVGIIGYILNRIYKYILTAIYRNTHNVSINGYWVAVFTGFDNEDKGKVELVRIIQKREEISYDAQHYAKNHNKILFLKGKGIFRTLELYTYYQEMDKNKAGGGVLTLSLITTQDRDQILMGKYSEIDRNKKTSTQEGEYELRKINLTKSQRIKFFFRRKSFSSYNEIINHIKQNNSFYKKHLH